jgi:hypothetical protein
MLAICELATVQGGYFRLSSTLTKEWILPRLALMFLHCVGSDYTRYVRERNPEQPRILRVLTLVAVSVICRGPSEQQSYRKPK